MKNSNFFTLKAMVLALCFLFPHQSKALDPATVFAVGSTVRSIVEDLNEAINNVIANLDNAIDSNSFSTTQRLRVLGRELDEIARNNIDAVFEGISEQERQVLNDALLVINTLESGAQDAFDEADELVGRINDTLSTIPFMDDSPRLIEVQPTFFVADAQSDASFRLKGNGSFLDHGEPTLAFATKNCRLSQATRNTFEFSCEKLGTTETPALGIAELEGRFAFVRSKPWYKKLLGLVVDNDSFKEYPITVRLFPEQLGVVEGTARVEKTVREEAARQQSFSDGNPHCAGSRNKDFNFGAQAGWQIDVNTISPRCSPSSKSACFGLKNVSSTGFQYATRITNNGDCIREPLTRALIAKDGRGGVNGDVTWTEFRMVKVEEQVEMPSEQLFWQQQKLVSLPSGAKSVDLIVKQLDQAEVVVNANGAFDWFNVDVDVSNGRVVFRPKSIQEALE